VSICFPGAIFNCGPSPTTCPIEIPNRASLQPGTALLNDLGHPALLLNYSEKGSKCAFMGEHWGVYRSRTDIKLYKIPSLVKAIRRFLITSVKWYRLRFVLVLSMFSS